MNDDLALVECEHVARTFGHGPVAVVAVHDASCTVSTTSRVALVGPSGSGKSTLVLLMAGLDHATSGAVRWPAWGSSPLHDPSRAGVVFQGNSLIPSLSAAENAAFPLLLRGVEPADAMARARDSLSLVGLEGLAEKVPEELSGGQAQRVAVARVVTSRPQLILADEPTGQLDRATAELVVDVLLAAADHLGAGLLVSTHDPAVVARLRTTWRMRDGELRVAA
ncbi:MAG TPA: ATP-binding cassette domain-containing protein [Nocardioides sp.]|nr:ATP-binding cassette domain-containing protein [Nocardioides sp.]